MFHVYMSWILYKLINLCFSSQNEMYPCMDLLLIMWKTFLWKKSCLVSVKNWGKLPKVWCNSLISKFSNKTEHEKILCISPPACFEFCLQLKIMPLSQQQISVMKCHALIYCFNCFNLQDRETFRRTTDANILKVLGASRPLLQVCYKRGYSFCRGSKHLNHQPCFTTFI